MECFFKTVNKKNCISFQRCEGIYKLALNLGGNKKFDEVEGVPGPVRSTKTDAGQPAATANSRTRGRTR